MENYETSDRIITPVREALYQLAADQIAPLKSLDDASQPAVLLDLGTCDGRTTVPCFQDCIRRIRVRDGGSMQRPIVAIYEDHRHNDWRPLVTRNLKLELGDGVYPLVSNTSFFEETTARGSVDLAFSNCALHYLASGEPPASFQRALRHVTADPHSEEDAAATASFRETAAADWTALLLRRAAELKPGGRLVVSNFARDEHTGFHWGNGGTGASNYHVLADCVQELVDEGELTLAEQRRATSPAYYRSLAEHTAPLDDATSPVSLAGLALLSAELKHFPCPLRAELLAQRRSGQPVDVAAYARTFVVLLRSVTVWEVLRAFGTDSTRSADERAHLVDRVYSKFAAKVAARPEAFSFDAVLCRMVVEKRTDANPPAAVTPSTKRQAPDVIVAYARLWCLKLVLQTAGAASILGSRNDRLGDDLLLPLVVATALYPSAALLLACHVGWAWLCLLRAPFIWDLNWWDMLCDLGFAAVLVDGLLRSSSGGEYSWWQRWCTLKPTAVRSAAALPALALVHELLVILYAGHSGRIFSAEMARCSGPEHMTPNGAGPNGPFTPFTLPGAELRRVIAEAKATNETFSLSYVTLTPAPLFAPVMPAPIPSEGVTFSWDAGSGEIACEYVSRTDSNALLGKCTANETALLPPPSWLYSKLLVHTPRPRVGNDWDVGCRP